MNEWEVVIKVGNYGLMFVMSFDEKADAEQFYEAATKSKTTKACELFEFDGALRAKMLKEYVKDAK